MALTCGVLTESYIHQMYIGVVYLFHNWYYVSLKQILLSFILVNLLSGPGIFVFSQNDNSFFMNKAIWAKKSLLKTNEPKIINISSIAALGLGSSIAYACSKGAVNSLSLSLARTLAPKISVNTICPGYVKTDWHGSKKEIQNKSKANEKLVPLKRSALPNDIASTIMWFVNSKNLITGETVYVDGGLHLRV